MTSGGVNDVVLAANNGLEKRSIESLCLKVTSGGTPSRQNPRFYGGTIPWFKTGELKDWYLNDSEEKITLEATKASSAKIFPPDTVLMAMYGDGRTMTSLGILRSEAATNQACCAMMPDPALCNFKYLFYALKYHREELLKLTVAGAQRNLSGGIIRRFPIIYHPLPVQEKIVAILSAYDDLIENNTRRIQILEEMARALYREWFVEFRFPGHQTAATNLPEGKHLPQGWSLRNLVDVCGLVMGQSPESKYYNLQGDGLPFHQGVADFGERFIEDRVYCTLENRVAESGDILFSVRAPVGRLNLTPRKIIIGRGVCAIHPDDNRRCFIFEQLKEQFKELDSMGNGAIFKAVTKTEVQGIKIVIPPDPIANEFERVVTPLYGELSNLYNRNGVLRQTRDLLLPKLVSGHLDASNLAGDLDKSV